MPVLLPVLMLLVVQSDGAEDVRTYEDVHLDAVLAAEQLSPFAPMIDDRIAFVRIVSHDVFTPADPWPDLFNLAHVMTAQDVVERELLFAVGEPFQRLDETARNLRAMFVFSLVRVTPVRRASDGAIGVLVFVRDLWSLRFEQGFQVTGSSVDRLLLQLTERNLLGRAKVASARFTMDPSSWSLGETIYDPRLWGGALQAGQRFDLYFSRANGAFDGSAGYLMLGAPLTNLQQAWGFELGGGYDARTVRQLRDGEVLSWDAPGTTEVEQVPRVWSQRSLEAEVTLRRQFTSLLTHRLGVGLGVTDDFVEPSVETALPAQLRDAFAQDVLPAVRRTVFPFVTYHGFATRYRTYEDLDSYGVSEAVRLGPSLSVTMGAGSKAALSSSDTVFAAGAVGAALDPLGGLIEAALEASARWEDGVVRNRVLAMRLRLATPAQLAGRLLWRADTTFRRDDATNTLVTLGGDNGLRGYPSQAFFGFGASAAQTTLEWRSLPVDLASAQAGLAAFYDAGAIFTTPTSAVPHHSIGLGVRFLFPQLNRGVYRLDVAVPLDRPGLGLVMSFGDTQAVEHARAAFERLAPRK